MALCVEVGAGGALQLMAVQPATVAGCPYVVVSGTDYVSNPWNFSVEDAGLISAAVIGVWLIGWAIRLLIQMLREREGGAVE